MAKIRQRAFNLASYPTGTLSIGLINTFGVTLIVFVGRLGADLT